MKHYHLPIILAAALVTGGAVVHGQTTQTPPPSSTKVNQQGGQTADQQSQSKPDLALAQRIRKAVVADKTLSTDAHNCKIITRDGAVTLRGVVRSEKEKSAINDIAVKIAGDGKVTNDLSIKPSK